MGNPETYYVSGTTPAGDGRDYTISGMGRHGKTGLVSIGPDGNRVYHYFDGSGGVPAEVRAAFDAAIEAYQPDVPHADYLTQNGYIPGVAEYLLGGEGFRINARPGTENLGRAWGDMLDELLRAGQMRRSQTGRYYWVTQ